MVKTSNITKGIKWKSTFLTPHSPFPGQSVSLLTSWITTCSVLLVDGKQFSSHISTPRPGVWVLYCGGHAYRSLSISSSLSDHMVRWHFPVPLELDVTTGLVLVNKMWVEMMYATSRVKLQEPVHNFLHFPFPFPFLFQYLAVFF